MKEYEAHEPTTRYINFTLLWQRHDIIRSQYFLELTYFIISSVKWNSQWIQCACNYPSPVLVSQQVSQAGLGRARELAVLNVASLPFSEYVLNLSMALWHIDTSKEV